jgi:hypothetical protein
MIREKDQQQNMSSSCLISQSVVTQILNAIEPYILLIVLWGFFIDFVLSYLTINKIASKIADASMKKLFEQEEEERRRRRRKQEELAKP